MKRYDCIAVTLAFAVALGSCERSTTDLVEKGSPVGLTIQTNVGANSFIALIMVEVTGTGIPVPVVANFVVEDGVAQGTVKVPAGNDRLFTARAFDAQGNVTHEGSVMEDVRPQMSAVRISLAPRGIGVPIEATISSYQVSLSPTAVAIAVAQSVQFTAAVVDGGGNPVALNPGELTWGSTNPAIVQVDANGLAMGWYEGVGQIVVSYEGVAAAATVEVSGAGVGPSTIIFTEMMQNPAAVADEFGEWFEIHNFGTETVQLTGWRFVNQSAAQCTVPAGISLAAGEYLVLGRSSEPAFNGSVENVIVCNIPLANAGVTLTARNALDEVVDVVSFGLSVSGVALSLSPAAMTPVANDDPANWCPATTPYGLGDLGTPGQPNPDCP